MADGPQEVKSESMELLTVRQLSELTGMPRSTIQFYIREEILPPAQRLPNGRPIYGRVHAELLEQIKRLKAEGKSLEEIRSVIGNRGRSAAFYQVDAAEAIQSATRARIVEAAAREFGRNGYNRASLSDIVPGIRLVLLIQERTLRRIVRRRQQASLRNDDTGYGVRERLATEASSEVRESAAFPHA